jgi:hypothetical protein
VVIGVIRVIRVIRVIWVNPSANWLGLFLQLIAPSDSRVPGSINRTFSGLTICMWNLTRLQTIGHDKRNPNLVSKLSYVLWL